MSVAAAAIVAAAYGSAAVDTTVCPEGATVAFVGADVLTMSSAATERERSRTVVVRDGRIVSVSAAPAPADACVVDARGKVLLPGLTDMHAHMMERDLALFLAAGVTLVREMNGSPAHLAMRDRIARGQLAGPRLLVASPLLAGTAQRYRHRLVQNAADAEAAAQAAADAGYDFLKVYDGLSAEAYAALVAAGARLHLGLDGHIPAAVGLERALAAGQALQHMDKIAFALAGHEGDTSRIGDVPRLIFGRTVWVTPTLASLRALDAAGTSEYAAVLARPEVALVDPELVGWWRSLARDGTRTYAPSPFYRFQTKLLRALETAGARLLLGTDASNPLMVPG